MLSCPPSRPPRGRRPAARAEQSQEDNLTSGPDYVHATASLAYVARELAARGMIAVAIDVHAKEELTWGGEPDPFVLQTALVKLHLSILGRMSSGETFGLSWAKDLAGQIDTTRIAMVGHSSGAGYAAAANARGVFPELKAIVALQPALNTPAGLEGLTRAIAHPERSVRRAGRHGRARRPREGARRQAEVSRRHHRFRGPR
ncbi:MAG: hypothetical protein V9F04_17835 [Dermatophilaceae bacterium]